MKERVEHTHLRQFLPLYKLFHESHEVLTEKFEENPKKASHRVQSEKENKHTPLTLPIASPLYPLENKSLRL